LVFTCRESPANIEAFTHSTRYPTLERPRGRVLLDAPAAAEVFYGERPGKANLEISLPADLPHAI
jgi:hypothetical protein